MPPAALLLAAERVVLPDRILRPGWVRVQHDQIVGVGPGDPAGDATRLGSVTVAPGFVDMHCHGGGGAAFTDGADAARVVLATHLRHGTTALLASLVTDRVEVLEQQVRALAALVAADQLLGVHLEGPWLADAYRGAHDPALLRDPHPGDVERLLAAAPGAVRMVTLAPERQHGLAAVARLVEDGVVAAIGHSDATYAQAGAAIEAGASVVTHLFNAHRPVHHREPGLALAAAEDPGVTLELVADGVHVHPALVGDVLRTRVGRVALVTDAMAAAGSGDGSYRLGPLAVQVRDGVARVGGPTGPIAGSTLTLDRALRCAVHAAGVDLLTAVTAATRVPADALGRPDLGRLAPGARADLVVLDDDLQVRAVMRAGAWLPSPSR